MRNRSLAAIGVAIMMLWGARADAQSLAARVAAARTGAVTFHYSPRPGVCGDGETFIRTGRSSFHGSFTVGRPMEPCIAGPVQVRMSLRDGAIVEINAFVGPLRSRNARDLGAVAAPEAASYLMSIAARGDASASTKVIFPAVLADSAVVWPLLLAIAKDTDTRSQATRRDALFWLSRFASGATVGRSNDPFAEDDREGDKDDELKKHAVFVVSQLPRAESVPTLLEIARSNRSAVVRSQALFWLGQSGDPRAIALFEAVLRR